MAAPSETFTRRHAALRDSLGPAFTEALDDPQVTELLLNPDDSFWVERYGEGCRRLDTQIPSQDREAFIRLLASHVGREVGPRHHSLEATLPGSGARVKAYLPPVSEGPCITVRKPAARLFSLEDYRRAGILTHSQHNRLRTAIAQGRNILLAGGTGSGKTTLANAILAEPEFRDARVLLIEDTPELRRTSANDVRLLTQEDPPVSMTSLIKGSLRMRPDRLVIGEVRDGAALDLLKAWNTGHPGSLTTLHANGAEDALYRLEELVGEVVLNIPRPTIVRAVQLIVFIRRALPEERTPERPVLVATVSELLGQDAGGRYLLDPCTHSLLGGDP